MYSVLLLVYALATIGAAKLLFLSGERQVAAWEIVVPFLALVVIGYTLFRNAATRQAGEKLMAEEGLAAGTRPRT